MTKLRSIILGFLILSGISSHGQQMTLKQLEEWGAKFEKQEWAKKSVPPMDAFQIHQKWEAQRLTDPAKYEKMFTEFRQEIHRLLPKIFRKAMADQNLNFGALNLYNMFARFQAVKVYTDFFSQDQVQADPYRDTDFYIADYQMAVLNRGFLLAEHNRRLNILLHVFLGASGYEDGNYQLTVALTTAEKMLAKSEHVVGVEIHGLFPQNDQELYRRPTFVAGGFTGTNGGGDSSSAWVKTELLQFARAAKELSSEQNWSCRAAWSNPTNYLRDIQSLQIESTNELYSTMGYRRIAIGSYRIKKLPSVLGGTDLYKGPSLAREIVVGILVDLCESKYPPVGEQKKEGKKK